MPEQSHLEVEARINELRARHPDDRAFIDALIEAAQAIETRDERIGMRLGQEALTLSRELGYERGETLGLLIVGTAHYLQQRNHEAFRLILEAQPRLDSLGDPMLHVRCNTVLAGLHYTMGNHQKALEHGYEAIAGLEGQPTIQWKGWANYMIGDSYRATGDAERAREHYQNAYEVFIELGDPEGVGRALNGIGNVFRMTARLDAATEYFSRALQLFQEENEKMGILRSLSDLALVCQARGEYDEALRLFGESLEIRRERAGPLVVATCLIDLGKLFLAMERPDDAITRLNEALSIAREADHKPRIHASLEALAEAYRMKGEMDTALQHYMEFHRVNVDVLSTDTDTRLQHLEISLEAAAAQKEAQLVRAYNEELKEKNDELARLLQELKDAQEMLVQSEKMASLGQLTAGIAHEIRNPLNFVNNFSVVTKDLAEELADEITEHRLEKIETVEDKLRGITEEIIANAERILEHGSRAGQIVNSMLVHSRQSGGRKTEVDVNELVLTCIDLAFHGFTADKEEFEPALECDFDTEAGTFQVIEDEVARVITNILNNAFYATHEHARSAGDGFQPRVRVQTARRDGMIEITVADNGSGIPDEHKGKVFEPFFTTKPTGSGTGLGLSQSYEIVTKRHGGTLKVTDTQGGGATFVVGIPVG
ncbi:MAG TPA: tetratricopeptide repeat protein [Rhodothermia bacterium]